MNNPFKEGDKVTTKVKGQPIDAVVVKTWNNEVQVRTADKKLLWRTVKTVTLVEAVTSQPESPQPSPEQTTADPVESQSEPANDIPEVATGPALAASEPLPDSPTPEPEQPKNDVVTYKKSRRRLFKFPKL